MIKSLPDCQNTQITKQVSELNLIWVEVSLSDDISSKNVIFVSAQFCIVSIFKRTSVSMEMGKMLKTATSACWSKSHTPSYNTQVSKKCLSVSTDTDPSQTAAFFEVSMETDRVSLFKK